MARNTDTRLTFEGDNRNPTWTPDGTRIAFGSPLSPLSWKLADGTGQVEALADAESPRQLPHAFSPDGTVLVFEDRLAGDVGMLALDGDRTSTLLLQDEWLEGNPSLSPDGR